MKTSLLLAAALAAGVALPALAQTGEQPPDGWNSNEPSHQRCLQIGRIWSWRAPDNRTLIVENDTHEKYKVDLLGYCPSLTFKQTLAFKSIGGVGLSCITPGDIVFFHDVGMETRCVISKVSAYTPQMEKADKAAREQRDHEQ